MLTVNELDNNKTTMQESIQTLHNLLEDLENNYGEILKRENVKQDIRLLKYTVEDCIKGSPEAEQYLRKRGGEILEEVKIKLEQDINEQTRLMEESQCAKNFTGGKIHRISEALAETESAMQLILSTIRKND